MMKLCELLLNHLKAQILISPTEPKWLEPALYIQIIPFSVLRPFSLDKE